MRINTIDVVHNHPFVLTYAFPDVRSLASSVLSVNLFGMIIVEMVYLITYHVLYATRILLCHIGHEITPVGHLADVCIKHLYLLVGIFEKQLGFCLQSGKIFVGIAIVKLCSSASILTDGKVNHRLANLRIPYCLWGPGASYLAKSVREQLVDACFVVSPVYQVIAGHKHQSAIVSPSILSGALPLGSAQTHITAKDM